MCGSSADGTRHPRKCVRILFDMPDSLEPHHWCRNKRCLNPDHIEWVTHAQHSVIHKDGVIRARAARARKRELLS